MKNKIMLIALILLNGLCFAQNVNDAVRLAQPCIISTAKSLGMGNSSFAQNSDYSAMVINPAGLALLNKTHLSGSLYSRFYDNNSDFLGKVESYQNSTTELSQISYLYKYPTSRGSFVYGFGYQKEKDFTSKLEFSGFNNNSSMIENLTKNNDDIPYLLNLSYPVYFNDDYLGDKTLINGKLEQEGSIIETGSINRYSCGFGLEIARGVFFGGSINYLSGNYLNNRNYYENDNNNYYQNEIIPNNLNTVDFQEFSFNDIIKWNLNAWEYRFGFIFNFQRYLKFGISAKLPTKYSIKEVYSVDAYSIFAHNIYELSYNESFLDYNITTPLEVSFGTSIDFYLINISAQATLIDYSKMEFSGNLDKRDINENNRAISDYLRPVLNLNLGAEFKIPLTKITTRAGIIYQPSPYVNDPISFDRLFLNVGAGFAASKTLQFDIAYSFGLWDTYSDNYGANQSRVYQEINSHTLLISTIIVY